MKYADLADLRRTATASLVEEASKEDTDNAAAWDALRMQLALSYSRACDMLYDDLKTIPTWAELMDAFNGKAEPDAGEVAYGDLG